MNNATSYVLSQQNPVRNFEFDGIIIDSGAAFSSSGYIDRYYNYCSVMGHTPFIDTTKGKLIRFSIGKEQSKGVARVDFPLGILWLTFHIHVVDADIPIIMGIQDMEKFGVYLNNLEDKLIHQAYGFTADVVRYRGHAYVRWDPQLQSHFTTIELHRLHRRFGHPSVDKLSNFLRRAELDDNPGHTRKALEAIEYHCDPCQRYAQSPRRFKFKLKDNFEFNHVVYADVFYINKKPILHVVDEGTYYQAATWLKSMNATDLWNAIRRCWIDVYIGPPDIITHDAGKNFIAKAFQQQADLFHIETKEVPVEAANSMSIVERYHLPVKRAFEIIKRDAPDTDDTDALQMSIKSVNDSIGPHGLIPKLLVYGALPRLGLREDLPHPSIYKCAKDVVNATRELSKRYAQRQVKSALATRNGPNVQAIHETCIGQPVLVYRDTLKEWTGPFRLLSIEGEVATVQTMNKKSTFRTTHVKPYHTEDVSLISDKPLMNNISTQYPIQFCYVINSGKEDELSAAFRNSRTLEFNNLMERNDFRIVPRTDARGYRIYGGRFVDEIKNVGTAQAFEKSLFVVQAYKYNGDDFMTYAPTVQRVSQRILLCLSACDHDLILFTRDISQAYVQSNKPIIRNIYVEPPKMLGIDQEKLLKIILPLYGLPESGLLWFQTYHSHHVQKLSMTSSIHDMCFLFTPGMMESTRSIRGATCLQTDDTSNIGNRAFVNLEEKMGACFDRKPIIYLHNGQSIEFNGADIKMNNDVYTISQDYHKKHLQTLPESSTVDKTSFISQRARGAYLASISRPDLIAGFAILAQHKDPLPTDVHMLNKLINKAKHVNVTYKFSNLDNSSISLFVFTDSSFATNRDLSSQLGFVIALVDKHGNANLIHYSSFKSRRIARSALAAELFALSHAFDVSSRILLSLNEIFAKDIPLNFFTDSKSLFDGIAGVNSPTEKRLLIDLSVLRQSYERREIAEVVWIPREKNPADAMTRVDSKTEKILLELMEHNKLEVKEEYWVERVNENMKQVSFTEVV